MWYLKKLIERTQSLVKLLNLGNAWPDQLIIGPKYLSHDLRSSFIRWEVDSVKYRKTTSGIQKLTLSSYKHQTQWAEIHFNQQSLYVGLISKQIKLTPAD